MKGAEIHRRLEHFPTFAPSNYHLFGSLKKSSRGLRFSSDVEVQEAVQKWLHNQPKTFYLTIIRKTGESNALKKKETMSKNITKSTDKYCNIEV